MGGSTTSPIPPGNVDRSTPVGRWAGRRRYLSRVIRLRLDRRAIGVVLGLAALAWPVAATTGHESDPVLELDPATVGPAGGVLVTGHGLDRSVTMRLTLEGTDARVALDDVEVDAAGHFERLVALPADLGAGVYGVKVSYAGELVVSSVLVIDPDAGPGRVVDRGPPGVVALVVVAVAALALLAGVRTFSSRRMRDPRTGSSA